MTGYYKEPEFLKTVRFFDNWNAYIVTLILACGLGERIRKEGMHLNSDVFGC